MNQAFQSNTSKATATLSLPPNLKRQLQKTIVKASSEGGTMSVDVALESALLSLGRCADLVRPAGTLSSESVSRRDWKSAVTRMEHFLDVVQRCCDPDHRLPARDWGKMSLENVKSSFSSTGLPFSFNNDIILYRYDPQGYQELPK
eukprot:scaffold22583_cov106-Cylindrotheca_fusiformis.AAC.24